MSVRSQSRSDGSRPAPLPEARRLRPDRDQSSGNNKSSVCYWPGRSGRLYRFSVHSLIECPPTGPAAYIVVRLHRGKRDVLHIGAAASSARTLNLAHIRRRGAQRGAHEVHLFAVSGTTADLRRAVRDLRGGLAR